MAYVAAAGPLANLMVASVVAVIFRASSSPASRTPSIRLADAVRDRLLQRRAGLFNLLPIPPLDGYNLVLPFLPADIAFLVQRYAQYGVIVLLLLVLLRTGAGADPLGWLFGAAGRSRRADRLMLGMHRVAQFFGHLRAASTPAETARARVLLPDAAWPLFAAMPVADRRHALDVAARLWPPAHDDPDLLAAALLHDAAKGHRMRLWHRVAGVLLEAVAPAAAGAPGLAGPAIVALPVPPLPPPRGALGRRGRRGRLLGAPVAFIRGTTARGRCVAGGRLRRRRRGT